MVVEEENEVSENEEFGSKTASNAAARLIICERQGTWALVFRRLLSGSGVPMVETRLLAECSEELTQWPHSMLVLELTQENAGPVFEMLINLQRDYPTARAILVAARSMRAYESLARELGALHFTTSPRLMMPVAGVVERHFARIPKPQLTITERLRASLPWSR